MKQKLILITTLIIIMTIIILIVQKGKNISTPNNIDTQNKILVFEHNQTKEIIANHAQNFEFYQDSTTIIAEYKCLGSCINYNLIGQKVLIKDNENLIIYNFEEKTTQNINLDSNPSYIYMVGYDDEVHALVYSEGENDIYYSLKDNKIIKEYSGYLSTENSTSLTNGYILGIRTDAKVQYYDLINIETGKIKNTYKDESATECTHSKIDGNKLQQYFITTSSCTNESSYKIFNNKYKPVGGKKEYDFYAFDSNGNIYLSNTNDEYITKYNSNGKVISKSNKYQKILALTNDFALVITNKDKLSIVDYSDKVIKEIEEWKDEYQFKTNLNQNLKKTFIFYIENTNIAENALGKCSIYVYNKVNKSSSVEKLTSCPITD